MAPGRILTTESNYLIENLKLCPAGTLNPGTGYIHSMKRAEMKQLYFTLETVCLIFFANIIMLWDLVDNLKKVTLLYVIKIHPEAT